MAEPNEGYDDEAQQLYAPDGSGQDGSAPMDYMYQADDGQYLSSQVEDQFLTRKWGRGGREVSSEAERRGWGQRVPAGGVADRGIVVGGDGGWYEWGGAEGAGDRERRGGGASEGCGRG